MPDDVNPAPRLLMGPGPINADPRVLRGSALIGPGPIRSRGAGLTSSGMGMLLQPVAGDVDAPRDPDLLAAHVLKKALERSEAPGTADEPAVQAHRHHA